MSASVVSAGNGSSDVTIYIGGVHASAEPVVIKTLLGSCISACLWDPVTQVGGMNHFMLPTGNVGEGEASRFGVHAMDCLIGELMKRGAGRRRLVAKVFGGAHVLAMRETGEGVPQQNIRFAREFFSLEAIPVLGEDVGGYQARQVVFHTDSGRVFVKRVGSGAPQRRLANREAKFCKTAPAFGDLTLFS